MGPKKKSVKKKKVSSWKGSEGTSEHAACSRARPLTACIELASVSASKVALMTVMKSAAHESENTLPLALEIADPQRAGPAGLKRRVMELDPDIQVPAAVDLGRELQERGRDAL